MTEEIRTWARFKYFLDGGFSNCGTDVTNWVVFNMVNVVVGFLCVHSGIFLCDFVTLAVLDTACWLLLLARSGAETAIFCNIEFTNRMVGARVVGLNSFFGDGGSENRVGCNADGDTRIGG